MGEYIPDWPEYIEQSVSSFFRWGAFSCLFALAVRSAEYLTSTPEPNPFYFGIGVTAGVDLLRYRIGDNYFKDNPAIIASSALVYTFVSKWII